MKNIKQKLFSYFAFTFVAALIIVSIYNYYQKTQIYLEVEDDYFINQKEQTDLAIEQNYPNYKVLKQLPHYSSNAYFDYRITTRKVVPLELVIVLSPNFTDQNQTEFYYEQTKSEILNWIISQGTIISNTKIKLYIDYNNTKTHIEDIN